jgi:hypothetical protein
MNLCTMARFSNPRTQQQKTAPDNALAINDERYTDATQYIFCNAKSRGNFAPHIAQNRVLLAPLVLLSPGRSRWSLTVNLFFSTNDFCFSTGSRLIPMT